MNQDKNNIDFDLPADEDERKEDVISSLQEFAKEYEAYHGVAPTYEDWWDEAVNEVEGDIYAFDKLLLNQVGNQWEFAGLGKSNWKKIWENNYNSSDKPTHKDLEQIPDKIKKGMGNIENKTRESSDKEGNVWPETKNYTEDKTILIERDLTKATGVISTLIVLCLSLIILHFDFLNLEFNNSIEAQFINLVVSYLVAILVFGIIFNILKYYNKESPPFYIKYFSLETSGIYIIGFPIMLNLLLNILLQGLAIVMILYPLLTLVLISALDYKLDEKKIFKPLTKNIIIGVLFVLNIIFIIWKVVYYFKDVYNNF